MNKIKLSFFLVFAALVAVSARGRAGAYGLQEGEDAGWAQFRAWNKTQALKDELEQEGVVYSRGAVVIEDAASKRWRGLTAGEIEMAKTVFRDGIKYEKVRVYTGKFFPFQPNDTVMTPNGNIYYPKNCWLYSSDLSNSAVDSAQRHVFIHEMTHVYQHQQGVHVIERRLEEGGIYKYQLAPGKSLNDYALEQQAEIVADYYTALAQGLPTDDFMPALKLFLENPDYLRAAEEARRSAGRETGRIATAASADPIGL